MRYVFFAFTLLSLNANGQSYDAIEDQIVGAWQADMLIIDVNSFEDSDTTFTVKVYNDNWEMLMQIKPPIIRIKNDGTFTSTTYNLEDELVQESNGNWWMDGDSLYMEDVQKTLYQYKVFIDGDLAEFKSWIDWDMDGKKDDHYFGVQKRKED